MLEKYLKACNNYVATPVLPKRETKVKNAFSTIASAVGSQRDLIRLNVIIGNDRILTGSVIYVSSDSYNSIWATTVYSTEEGTFILVPEASILLTGRE
jgi:hypothetical protein